MTETARSMTPTQVEARTQMWMALYDLTTVCSMVRVGDANAPAIAEEMDGLRRAVEHRIEVDPEFASLVNDHGGIDELMVVLTIECTASHADPVTVERHIRDTWRRCEVDAFNAEAHAEQLQDDADRLARKLSAARVRQREFEQRRALAHGLLLDVTDGAEPESDATVGAKVW